MEAFNNDPKPRSYGLNAVTLLTISRLIFSPIILPFLLVYLLPFNSLALNGVLAVLFLLITLVDFFDSYRTRTYTQVTWFGKILDPIADKTLFYAVLIALVAAQKLYFYCAVILIGREFFVLMLRNLACQKGHDLHVSMLAKLKMLITMAALSVIILTPYHGVPFFDAPVWHIAEWGLLASSIILSLYTAYQYHKAFVLASF
jgi:CDP-diacylglycerol--glycerol-3-phosphate 3-phosphatidyltransferase